MQRQNADALFCSSKCWKVESGKWKSPAESQIPTQYLSPPVELNPFPPRVSPNILSAFGRSERNVGTKERTLELAGTEEVSPPVYCFRFKSSEGKGGPGEVDHGERN